MHGSNELNNHFVVIYEQKVEVKGFDDEVKILLDKRTGDKYLFYEDGNSGGLTRLKNKSKRKGEY